MESHVSDTWQSMCVTHGMPCVTMHGLFKAYIYGVSKLVCGEGQQEAVRGSSKEKEEEGKRGREERRREREERRNGGKGKKKREEKRGGREEKERGKGRSVAQ